MLASLFVLISYQKLWVLQGAWHLNYLKIQFVTMDIIQYVFAVWVDINRLFRRLNYLHFLGIEEAEG